MENYKGRCTVDRALPATPPRKGKKGRVVSSGRETVGKNKLPLPLAKRLRNASRHLNRSSVKKDLEFDCDMVVATSFGLVTQLEDPAVKLAAKHAKVVASHARHKNSQVFATFGKPEFDKKLFEFPFYTHKGMIAWLDRYSLRRHRMRLIEYPHCFAWIFRPPSSATSVAHSANRFSALSGSHGEWTDDDDLAAAMPAALLPRNAPPPPGEVCPVCRFAFDDPAREDHRRPFRYRQCNHFNCFRCASLYWESGILNRANVDHARDTQIKCNVCRTWTNIRPNFFRADLEAHAVQVAAMAAANIAVHRALNRVPQPVPPPPPPPPPLFPPVVPVVYSSNPFVFLYEMWLLIYRSQQNLDGFVHCYIVFAVIASLFLTRKYYIPCDSMRDDYNMCVYAQFFDVVFEANAYVLLGILGAVAVMYIEHHGLLGLFIQWLYGAIPQAYAYLFNYMQSLWVRLWPPPPPVAPPAGPPPPLPAPRNISPQLLYTAFSYFDYVTVYFRIDFIFSALTTACFLLSIAYLWRDVQFGSFRLDRTPEADNSKIIEFYNYIWMTIVLYSFVGYKAKWVRKYSPWVVVFFVTFFLLPFSSGYNPYHLAPNMPGVVVYGANVENYAKICDDLGAFFGLLLYGSYCLCEKHLSVVLRTVLKSIALIFNAHRVYVGTHGRNMNLEYGYPIIFSDVQPLGNYTGYRTLNIYSDVHHAVFANRAASRWHPDLRRYIFGDTIQQLTGGGQYDVDIAYNTALSIIQRIQMTRALEGNNIDHQVDVPIGDVHW